MLSVKCYFPYIPACPVQLTLSMSNFLTFFQLMNYIMVIYYLIQKATRRFISAVLTSLTQNSFHKSVRLRNSAIFEVCISQVLRQCNDLTQYFESTKTPKHNSFELFIVFTAVIHYSIQREEAIICFKITMKTFSTTYGSNYGCTVAMYIKNDLNYTIRDDITVDIKYFSVKHIT